MSNTAPHVAKPRANDKSLEALKAALAAARAAVSTDVLQAQVRAILNDHGHGAKNLGELKPKYYATVTQCLKAISESEIDLSAPDDDADEEVETTPMQPSAMTFAKLRDVWVWCVEPKRFIRRKDGVMWDVQQFDSQFGHTVRSGKPSREIFQRKETMVKFERMVFHPGRPEIDGGNYNTWRASPIVPAYGDTRLWDQHLMTLVPDALNREQFLDWLAWVYQHQAEKPTHACLLVGETFGTGKSFIARVMEQLIGPANTQRPKNSSLRGDFNGWAAKCKLVIIEELQQIGRREVANELRDLITEPTVEVNMKNVPAFLADSFMAIFAVSNHPDALPLDVGDRRWLVINSPVTQSEKEDLIADGYFAELMPMVNPHKPGVTALAAIAYQLQHRPLGDYTAAGEAPMTAAKQRMIELGTSPVIAWLDEFATELEGRTVVNVSDDIIAHMPAHILRLSNGGQSAVAKYLASRLHGVNLGNQRVKGRGVVKLWAIGTLGEKLAADEDGRNRLGYSFGTIYADERAAAKTKAEATETAEAADDFGI